MQSSSGLSSEQAQLQTAASLEQLEGGKEGTPFSPPACV